MKRKKKAHPDPGNAITIDGIGRITPEASAMQLQTRVVTLTQRAARVYHTQKCISEYRSALQEAVALHIAAVLGDDNGQIMRDFEKAVDKLEVCMLK